MKDNKKGEFSRYRTLLRVYSYIGKYRIFLFISLLLALISVLLGLMVPRLIGMAVDGMTGKGAVDFARVRQALMLILSCILISGVCQWLMSLCNNRLADSMVRDIRIEAFKKIQELPLSYLDSHSHGEIESRIITDTNQISAGLLMGFTQLFSGIITITGTLIFMLLVSVPVALAVVILTPLSFFVAGFIAKRTFNLFKDQSSIRAEQTGLIAEMIEGHHVVSAYGRQKKVCDYFDRINEKLGQVSLKATFISSLTNPSTRFINGLIYAGVGVSGGLLVIRGRMSIGQLSAFLSYANQYTKPFNEISGVVTELQNAIACAAAVFSFIDETPQTCDKADAISEPDVQGRFDIENVSFSYTSDRSLIENLSLHVEPGQTIAIVGPTGCGKTTLINLLMRFYDVDKGSIYLDNTDIRDYTRHALRTSYGMVLQETWLKSASIRENITMANPDISEEEMIRIAKMAHIHSFVKRLPQGYDTVINGGGDELSQGQKQLLCIARVMMQIPSVMILDEATSSIDTRTEMKIQDAFAHMMKGRTSFIVAHRLSTIRDADIILVMKDGNIIEQGNHKSLMNDKGFYYQLYQSQFVMQ
ncbi:ABC transporter ATP-binding protein [Butyrivibrio sp. MC2013]|uniref:ABC transporter ATP-binding protein n=1 Tax=Butyrivibrio sp. MC2013 TaxID=1280686 RepID=UPI0003FD178F|nr:ABC transporter ATP-binding protein [Butyrivibrio sp. MC2013]